MMPLSNDCLIATERESGLRIDQLLCKRFPTLSRSYFQYLIQNHFVLLNGQPVKKRMAVTAGDVIAVTFAPSAPTQLEPEDIPLHILYEDAHLLVVNKPPGLVVHPGAGNWSGTFAQALLHHCKDLNADGLRPGIVHRLDKDTSGVLLAAKTDASQRKLVEMFALRQVYKEYLAICLGNPGSGEIIAPIGRDSRDRKRFCITEKGRPARTSFRTLLHHPPLSLVMLVLHTGRTHQIRVHMQHHKTPLLGDRVYGKALKGMRQMLHARRLRFVHPYSAKLIDVTAAPPPDFASAAAPLLKGAGSDYFALLPSFDEMDPKN